MSTKKVAIAVRAVRQLMATRPVFPKTNAGIRGHALCTFLALGLGKELMDRLAARKTKLLKWQHNDLPISCGRRRRPSASSTC
jgi:hypothetical protein